ncbi:MAG: ScyD/ScyE family protein [Bacteroidota bacterium]|nr:ScyD/ScyE family protein [Bacteroidota bacterium]
MRSKIIFQIGAIIMSTFFFASCKKDHPHFCDGNDSVVTTSKVFATGLNNPRGLKFGPDGNLYVAEGGIGGTNSSGKCVQVPSPVGPYTGSITGSRISRIDNDGMRTTWVDNLPSSKNSLGDISGVGDVAFIGHTLYAVITGAGCSHGVSTIPNGLIKVNPDRTWSAVANLSDYLMANPVKNPEPDDFEPDGDWYSLNYVNGNFYAVEANHGELVKITPSGNVTRVIDISATYGHIVPTSQAFHEGNFYIGNLDTFPAPHGGSSIYKVTPGGQISVFVKGFNMILGIAFDKWGGLYVLENTTNSPFPKPGTGDIVRIDPSGSRQIITTGLFLPTGMTFGPDGKLYVSNWGFGPPALGGGQILQISFKCDEMRGEEHK